MGPTSAPLFIFRSRFLFLWPSFPIFPSLSLSLALALPALIRLALFSLAVRDLPIFFFLLSFFFSLPRTLLSSHSNLSTQSIDSFRVPLTLLILIFYSLRLPNLRSALFYVLLSSLLFFLLDLFRIPLHFVHSSKFFIREFPSRIINTFSYRIRRASEFSRWPRFPIEIQRLFLRMKKYDTNFCNYIHRGNGELCKLLRLYSHVFGFESFLLIAFAIVLFYFFEPFFVFLFYPS